MQYLLFYDNFAKMKAIYATLKKRLKIVEAENLELKKTNLKYSMVSFIKTIKINSNLWYFKRVQNDKIINSIRCIFLLLLLIYIIGYIHTTSLTSLSILISIVIFILIIGIDIQATMSFTTKKATLSSYWVVLIWNLSFFVDLCLFTMDGKKICNILF